MYLSQAISHAPSLGIEWDLFQQGRLVEEDDTEVAEVACSVGCHFTLQHHCNPGRCAGTRLDKTEAFQRRIACNLLHLPSELDLGCRNPGHQEVRVLAWYIFVELFQD